MVLWTVCFAVRWVSRVVGISLEHDFSAWGGCIRRSCCSTIAFACVSASYAIAGILPPLWTITMLPLVQFAYSYCEGKASTLNPKPKGYDLLNLGFSKLEEKHACRSFASPGQRPPARQLLQQSYVWGLAGRSALRGQSPGGSV